MNFRVLFHPLLNQELQQVTGWYDDQLPGLGAEFYNEFEATVGLIQENPFAFSVFLRRFRQVKTNRFPYIIVYEIEEHTIYVHQVIHAHRHPGKKLRK